MADTALIIGAGDNLGSAIARRFSREGLHVIATRRRGEFAPLISHIEAEGGKATGVHSGARDEEAVINLIEMVEAQHGPISVCVFNVGGNVRFPIGETSSRVYRKVWEMCAFYGFLVGREVSKVMRERGRGTIIFTGASASLRGNAGFSAFAGGKHALRALAQSMARELGPEGIHVAHVIVDGLIQNPTTEGLFPEMYAERLPDGIVIPDDAAETYWHLHNQPRSTWTFELDIRPFKESW